MTIGEIQRNRRLLAKVLIFALMCLFFSCIKSQKLEKPIIEIFDKIYPPLNYRLKGAMINGKKEGLWITFDSLGKVESEETYLNGKNFGVVKLYSQGVLAEKSSDKIFLNDTVSYVEKYNFDGKVITKGQYVNGRKKGIWMYYFNNGEVLKAKVKYLERGSVFLFKSPKYSKDDY